MMAHRCATLKWGAHGGRASCPPGRLVGRDARAPEETVDEAGYKRYRLVMTAAEAEPGSERVPRQAWERVQAPQRLHAGLPRSQAGLGTRA